MLARRGEFEVADEDARLESRVVKIESDVTHLGSTVAVIQTDLRELRRETSGGFKTLDGKIEALRKETGDGFKEARKSLRTDLGLFLAGLSLLASAGLGIAALVFKT